MNGELLIEKLDTLIHTQTRLAIALEAIAQATASASPNYRYPFEQYPHFDWSLINAQLIEHDQYGATMVSWNGYTWKRRSWPTKYGLIIGFSRANGMGEDGVNWLTLITFKKMTDTEPLPEKVRQAIQVKPNGRQLNGKAAPASGEEIFDYNYQDGTEVKEERAREVFRQYKRVHNEQAPPNKQVLRAWHKQQKAILKQGKKNDNN